MPVPSSITTAPHRDLDLELVAGTWPDGLDGEVVLSAPQVDPALPAALFGFGRLCRLSLRPGTHGAPAGRFAWRTRVVDTPSQRLHQRAADRFVCGPTGYSSPFGMPNAANTAPLPWGDRLFATWDVGRPVEVDPVTLGFLGEVGHRRTWGAQTLDLGAVLPFLFSTAHPVIDPERDCMWTVKLTFDPSGGMQLHVVQWSGDGTEVRHWPVRDGLVMGSSHNVSQTRDFLVLADSGNFKTDAGEMAGGPRTATIDDAAAVYLIRKDVLDATPPGQEVVPVVSRVAPTTGHFHARWDDGDGVHVVFEHLDLMDLADHIGPDDLDAHGRPVDPALVGFYNTGMAPSSCTEVDIDPVTGRSAVAARHRDDRSWNLELSAMDWSLDGLRDPTLHHVAYQGFRPGAVTRRTLERYGDRVGDLPADDTPGSLVSLRRGSLEEHARWDYTDTGDHITSPAFAPRPGGTPGGHDGHVVLPVLSDDGFRVEVFDAATVGAGPVAVLAAPDRTCVPLLLHSAWIAAAGPAPDRERLRFGDELDDAAVDALGPELAGVVRSVARDLDDERA